MTVPSAAESGPSAALTAAQAALAAEHATVYGYGVAGALVDDEHREELGSAHAAHRAQRETLRGLVRELGGTPQAAAAGYALPFEVTDGASSLALAAVLEERLAGAYADLVRAAEGADRRAAAEELGRAALRAARWRGGPVPFPGLAEHADAGSGRD